MQFYSLLIFYKDNPIPRVFGPFVSQTELVKEVTEVWDGIVELSKRGNVVFGKMHKVNPNINKNFGVDDVNGEWSVTGWCMIPNEDPILDQEVDLDEMGQMIEEVIEEHQILMAAAQESKGTIQ